MKKCFEITTQFIDWEDETAIMFSVKDVTDQNNYQKVKI